jgi:hypothetical protein
LPRNYANDETGLSAMEIVQDVMQCYKSMAEGYTTAALEGASVGARRTFRQLGRDCERVAFHAWEILNAEGHYGVKNASEADRQRVEEMLDSFRRGEAVPAASSPPSQRWGRSSNYGGLPERGERSDLPEWARARV